MQESATTTTQSMESTYWRAEKVREVYTNDGKLLGTLHGILVDPTTWTVSQFVIEVKKNISEELNIKKPMMGDAQVNVPTSFVKDVSDVVQLNSNLASMKGAVSVHNKK